MYMYRTWLRADLPPPIFDYDLPAFNNIILFASSQPALTSSSLPHLSSPRSSLLHPSFHSSSRSLPWHPPHLLFPRARYPAEPDPCLGTIRTSLTDTQRAKTPPIWFSGVPFVRGNNPLLVFILQAPVEDFALDTDSDSSTETIFEAAERAGESSGQAAIWVL